MGLIAIEGFDHEANNVPPYSSGGSGNRMFEKTGWSDATSNPLNFDDGRLPYSANSRSLTVIDNNPLIKTFPTQHDEFIIGFGAQFRSDVFNSGYTFFSVNSAISLAWNYAGQIVVYDTNGTTVATGITQTSPNEWVYIELDVHYGAGGWCELHLSGVPGEVPHTSGNFGSGRLDTLKWSPQGLGATMLVDDFYCLDPTTGGINTSFLGDVVVETLYPINDGTYKQWTPDTGSIHYVRVDEGQLDGDTSYVHTTTAGALDSYGMGNPTLTNTPIYGVQLNLGTRKNDGGGRTIAPLIRQGGANYFGPITALTASYAFHSWLLEQDPTGGTWLYTTINNDEFGAELVS